MSGRVARRHHAGDPCVELRLRPVVLDVAREQLRQRGILQDQVPFAVSLAVHAPGRRRVTHRIDVRLTPVAPVPARDPEGGLIAHRHLFMVGAREPPTGAADDDLRVVVGREPPLEPFLNRDSSDLLSPLSIARLMGKSCALEDVISASAR